MFRRVNVHFLLGIAFVWLFTAYAVSWMLFTAESPSETNEGYWTQPKVGACSEEAKRASSALKAIELLKKQNKLLQEKLLALNTPAHKSANDAQKALVSPLLYNYDIVQFEEARRRVENGISEFWRYTSANLMKMADMDVKEPLQALSREMLIFLAEHKRVITRDMIQSELALKLPVWKDQRSRYALDRTVTLESKNWQYSGEGWESVFLPISSCTVDNSAVDTWKDDAGSEQQLLLDLPVIDNITEYTSSHERPPWLPLAVPEDLLSPIIAFHKNPSVWWLSQVVNYLWQYQPAVKDYLEHFSNTIRFHSPVVGVHVRRTDKLDKEAARHEIEEYMRYVNEYYDQLETEKGEKLLVRRIYLSSDDQSVLKECKTKFPNYDVIANVNAMISAVPDKRYSEESLRGIITDIHFLSLSDHLVCTFSSQVCRLAYEIMQTRFPDATDHFKSLDDIYYYGGQNVHRLKALLPHAARSEDEISFSQGDLLGIAGNLWNGFSVGEHVPTLQKGRFPSYKVGEHFVTYNTTQSED